MKKTLVTFLCATALVSSTSFAGVAHDHGRDHGPKHGGIAQEIGDMTYELVARADTLTLYVSTHGVPYATTGAKAEATLHAASSKTTVSLFPAGDNRLAAQGSFKTGLGVRVAVTVSVPGKPEAKANFRLK